jgi:hypothetical protein
MIEAPPPSLSSPKIEVPLPHLRKERTLTVELIWPKSSTLMHEPKFARENMVSPDPKRE